MELGRALSRVHASRMHRSATATPPKATITSPTSIRGRVRAFLIASVLSACFVSATVAGQVDAGNASPFVGRWEGSATAQGRQFTVAIDIVEGGQGVTALVDYPDVPVYAAPFQAQVDGDRIILSRHPVDGPESRMEASRTGSRLRGTFTGAGARDAALELVRRHDSPSVLSETPVRFANDGVALAGTVVWPQGAGPFPAVVISHGSGPGHRDQALYRTEAFRYARQGVAALVYDKRGCGESGGDWRSASLDDLARDALAGLRALQASPRIRGDAIGVAGHSQGGWIAPLVATLSPDVAFVIATSASGLDPMAQSLHHNANEMRAAGFGPAEIEAAQALRRRLYDGVRAGGFPEALERDLTTASKQPWFAASALPTPPIAAVSNGERAMLLFDPLPVWRAVRVPVLAIWGADDIHLPAARSRDLVARELAAGGNTAISLHVVPAATHGFMRSPDGDAAWDFPRGELVVERQVSAWLRQHVVAGTE